MLIKNSLRKEVTPERVFAVLKLINEYDGKMQDKDIYSIIQPKSLGENDEAVRKIVKFLMEENMIKADTVGKIGINIDKANLKSIDRFKEYVSKNIFLDMAKESIFLKVTKEMLDKDKEIYELTGFESIGLSLNTNINKEFILAWRFWAEFIGIGKIMNEQILINPYKRIQDRVLSGKYSGDFLVADFLSILKEECREFENTIENNKINLSLSLALRTLEKLGKIKLVTIKDSLENWKLYYSAIDIMEITNIIILEEVN